eukprot:Nk52_evm4s2568 gene=Nk52_evmTU4s2568
MSPSPHALRRHHHEHKPHTKNFGINCYGLFLVFFIVLALLLIILLGRWKPKPDPDNGKTDYDDKGDPKTIDQLKESIFHVCNQTFFTVIKVNHMLQDGSSDDAETSRSKGLNPRKLYHSEHICETYWKGEYFLTHMRSVCPSFDFKELRLWKKKYLTYGTPSIKYVHENSQQGRKFLEHLVANLSQLKDIPAKFSHCRPQFENEMENGGGSAGVVLEYECLLVESVLCQWLRSAIHLLPEEEPNCSKCGRLYQPEHEYTLRALAVLRLKLHQFFCKPERNDFYNIQKDGRLTLKYTPGAAFEDGEEEDETSVDECDYFYSKDEKMAKGAINEFWSNNE